MILIRHESMRATLLLSPSIGIWASAACELFVCG
ncbi:hypothetical protein EV653_0632 [Kribbella pratensis]|uniref:Uncharacterized protein n=1 Tax=Kribbella pratensis TaxID=2512112 RepID=A0A4R8CGP6_9ACTN|nr:hypothetical protein EV653_0632 [Kribbella pratensis]